jgi:hypothetical protein
MSKNSKRKRDAKKQNKVKRSAKRRGSMTNDYDRTQEWWWLAINGSSCAACFMATPAMTVSPTPELLVGFSTRDEQLRTQKFLLTAPIDDVTRFLTTTLKSKADNNEVALIRPALPKPPCEQTTWIPATKEVSV